MSVETTSSRNSIAKGILYSLALFALALLPRVSDLAAIVTPDERRWVERSTAFFSSLLQGDWAGTFQTGHPGVTTMWTGSIGLLGKYLTGARAESLLEFLEATPTRPAAPPDYLLSARLPTAVITALSVVLVFWMVRRLFGTTPALFATVLLALDPFYLAHSRVIHHDALVTTFVLAALLGFVGWSWNRLGRGWLIGSAVATGFAVLSKGSALFLLPFIGMLWLTSVWVEGGGRWPAREALRSRICCLALWAAVVVAVFVLAWPAMWVDPIGTVSGMLDKAIGYAQEAHSNGNFFLGHPVEDPGLLFYPVAFLFRTTPISLIGSLVMVVLLVRKWREQGFRQRIADGEWLSAVSLLAFVVLFTTFMSFGSKKFDRYLLPVFPPIDILAGIAFAVLATRLAARRRAAAAWVGAGILLFQGLASLPQHPYYLSAYNVLAGGPWLAQRAILVGWGEGLEQAAAYLNAKSTGMRVSTFYDRDFQTFYDGEVLELTDDNPDNIAPWRNSDYVVFYINQVQRKIPVRSTVSFFQTLTPEFTFERNGIPYVQVYRTPTEVPESIVQEEATLVSRE